MFMNNRSPEKKEKGGFGERPKIANKIYELCGILLEQPRDVDDSCSENVSAMSFSKPPDHQKCLTQKSQNDSSLKKAEESVKNYSFNSISFEKQKHTGFSVSTLSRPLIQNNLSDVKISHATLPTESKTCENRRLQRHTEFVSPTFNEPLSDKSGVSSMNRNTKRLSVSHNQLCLDTQVTDNLKNIGNRNLIDIIPYDNLNIMYGPVLKNDSFFSDSSLHSEDTFATAKTSTTIQDAISSYCESIADWNKLFHGGHLYTEQQNLFPFNSLETRNDNNFHRKIIHKADQMTKHNDGLKSKPGKFLSSMELENKMVSFNFLLQLKNQRERENFDTKKALRRASAPSNAGFISEIERNCFLVQANWLVRKCKSEVQILQETRSTAGIKFLKNNNCKESRFDSNSDIFLQRTASEESPNLKGIPTLRGRKLPVKVSSTLLLNSPILLNYTEGISGKSQEILMCTSDSIGEIIRNEKNVQHQDIVKKLLVKSRPYIGKPIHILFEPRKETKTSSLVVPVSLPPSPGKYSLLAETSSGDDFGGKGLVPLHLSPGKCNLLDEANSDMTYIFSENNSNVTLVAQQSDQLKGIENRMDSSGLDSSAQQDDGYETSNHFEARKKLKIRLCRRKKSRTDLKRVNVKKIVGSVFRKFFHFYSLVGGHLKSGSVITKSNSILWLREAGVAKDPKTMEAANELFKDIAGAKVVLNIFDYTQFIIQFARRQRVAAVDLIRQLTLCEVPKGRRNSETGRHKTFRQFKSSMAETASINRSRSLPNLKIIPQLFNN